MTCEGCERPRHPAQDRVRHACLCQLDLHCTQGLAERPVDHGALVCAQGANPVTGAEEGEVLGDDPVQEPGKFPFHAVLGSALVVCRVGGGERTAAHNHA